MADDVQRSPLVSPWPEGSMAPSTEALAPHEVSDAEVREATHRLIERRRRARSARAVESAAESAARLVRQEAARAPE